MPFSGCLSVQLLLFKRHLNYQSLRGNKKQVYALQQSSQAPPEVAAYSAFKIEVCSVLVLLLLDNLLAKWKVLNSASLH